MSRIRTHVHAIALVYDVLTAMTMAMLQQIAQTKSQHQAFQQDTEMTILTQDGVIGPNLRITIMTCTITMTIKTGIGLAGPDPIHAAIDTGVTVAVTPITDPCTCSITSHHGRLKHILPLMRHPT